MTPISPHMPIKTADEVMSKYKRFMTKDSVGRVAIKLARNTYFGEAVLGASTITGNPKTRSLDPNKLNEMKAALCTWFQETSPTEFEMIWSRLLIPRSTVKSE